RTARQRQAINDAVLPLATRTPSEAMAEERFQKKRRKDRSISLVVDIVKRLWANARNVNNADAGMARARRLERWAGKAARFATEDPCQLPGPISSGARLA
ncbi:hypothetical protein LTR28_000052, partial [Elasticomyces elasticus]